MHTRMDMQVDRYHILSLEMYCTRNNSILEQNTRECKYRQQRVNYHIQTYLLIIAAG